MIHIIIMIEDSSIMIDNLVTMIVVVRHQDPSAMINIEIVLVHSMMINSSIVVIILAHSMINSIEITLVHSVINVIVPFTIINNHITIKIDHPDPLFLIITETLRVMTMKTWEVTQLQSMKKMTGWITPMIQCQNAKIPGKIHDVTQEVVVEDLEMIQGVLGKDIFTLFKTMK